MSNNSSNNPDNLPSIFTFTDPIHQHVYTVRTLMIDGKPHFAGPDVTETLGYTNGPKAIRDHCRHAKTITIRSGNRGNPNITYIPEGDLYRLIMRSKLPAAQAFEAWVCDEVLPRIRATGSYIKGEEHAAKSDLSMEEMTLMVMSGLQTKVAALMAERAELERSKTALQTSVEVLGGCIEEQKTVIEEQAPKVEFHDDVIKEGTFPGATTNTLANCEGVPVWRYCRWARERGFIYRPKGMSNHHAASWMIQRGYAIHYKSHYKKQPKYVVVRFTEAGVRFLRAEWDKDHGESN